MDRLVYEHCKFYLAGQNLVNVDRASMAASVEVRAPFLDHRLVELAGTIPPTMKLRGVRSKYILKAALRDVLPAVTLSRRKQGFGVPLGHWLRGPLRSILEDRLHDMRVADIGLFKQTRVSQLIHEHLDGHVDRTKALWSLLMFDAWRDHYLPRARWS
jgi:asparagine synthase (glutamine-hydrolysing)